MSDKIADPTDPKDPTGGPAFPLYLGVYAGTAPPHIKGMSLREWYAGRADIPWNVVIDTLRLKGVTTPTIEQGMLARAQMKFMEADAILAARSKPIEGAR